jgi:hypothetical protein
MSELNDAAEGVANSFDIWLEDNRITVKNAMEHAIHKAFAEWLEANTETLIDRIGLKRRTQTIVVKDDLI